MKSDFLNENKGAWNSVVDAHFESQFYDVAGFLDGKSTLNEIELELLGDVSNKKLLHLQCHFGLDTLSLARLGAKVCGVDFSEKAINQAKELAQGIGVEANFVNQNIQEFRPQEGAFDVVFTSYGTIAWLPELSQWAACIAKALKPGSSFVFVDFHPTYWMFDADVKLLQYSYFNRGVIFESQQGSYAAPNGDFEFATHTWNHSIDDIVTALLKQGLVLNQFRELDYSPYPIFSNSVEREPGKYQIAHQQDMIPLILAMKWIKQADDSVNA